MAIGLVGTTILGIPAREWSWMLIGSLVVGLVAGVFASGRPPAVGLAVGTALAFPALIAIQLGTMIDTFINTEDLGELLGVIPLAALIWAGFVIAGLLGFGVAVAARRRLGQASTLVLP